jgi:catechol 2,3-dioxygenase-like lactoylglutathione lyase family enzyme
MSVDHVRHGALHHIELWVPNLDRAVATWGWLLGELGYELFQDWPGGQSWRSGPTYIVLEQSPARTASRHDRSRPGLNHLAFHVATAALTEALATAATQHGWRLMFADQHPYAGGTGHYAAYLENVDGYEAELVALEVPAALAAAPPSRTAAPPVSEAPALASPAAPEPVVLPEPESALGDGPPWADEPASADEPAPALADEKALAEEAAAAEEAAWLRELVEAGELTPEEAEELAPEREPDPAPAPAGGTPPDGAAPPAGSA